MVQKFNEAILYIVWCKRNSEIQDSVTQTGIFSSQSVHSVDAQFQGPSLCFQVQEFSEEAIFNIVWFERKSEIYCNKRGNNINYISVCIQYSCAFATAIFMFPRSRKSMKLFLILYDACGIHKLKIAQILKTNHWIWLVKIHDCALNGMIKIDK